MTNNFERVIGEGGFGVVYHGFFNDTEQVAVKVLSHSSTQGYKQFKAEVPSFLCNKSKQYKFFALFLPY